jgi:hypothetical protein
MIFNTPDFTESILHSACHHESMAMQNAGSAKNERVLQNHRTNGVVSHHCKLHLRIRMLRKLQWVYYLTMMEKFLNFMLRCDVK